MLNNARWYILLAVLCLVHSTSGALTFGGQGHESGYKQSCALTIPSYHSVDVEGHQGPPTFIALWPISRNTVQLVFRAEYFDSDIHWRRVDIDGAQYTVQKLGEHQFPYQQPSFEVGYGAATDNAVVILEKRIALKIPVDLSSGRVYEFRSNRGDIIRWQSRIGCTMTPVFQGNQTAYQQQATHQPVYLSWWLGSAGGLKPAWLPSSVNVLHYPSLKPLTTLPVKLRRSFDNDVAGAVGEVDLAGLKLTTPVILEFPDVGVSHVMRFSTGAQYESIYKKLMFALLHNRFGFAIDQAWSTWPRAQDHTEAIGRTDNPAYFKFFSKGTPSDTSLSLSGGHFDAGDFDIRPSHTAVARLLMSTFELSPGAFTDAQHGTAEPDNGIPDILDEALWSLKAWALLQSPDGAVRAGVESHRHPWGIYSPEADPLPYWTYGKDPNTSARVAGLFAQMARLIKPFDASLSDLWLKRATRAWAWAKANDAMPAWKLYAVSELLRLTNDSTYLKEFKKLWRSFGEDEGYNVLALEHLSLSDYQEGRRIVPDYFLSYLLSGHASIDDINKAKSKLSYYADQAISRLYSDKNPGHRTLRRDVAQFGWGQAVVQGRYLDPMFARMRLGSVDALTLQRYRDALHLAAGSVLGANPMGISWIAGTGERSPERILHLQSLAEYRKQGRPITGLTVFGPATGIPQYEWMQPALKSFIPAFNEHPPMWRYADIRTFPHVNEFTVWETQVPQIQLFGALMATELMTSNE